MFYRLLFFFIFFNFQTYSKIYYGPQQGNSIDDVYFNEFTLALKYLNEKSFTELNLLVNLTINTTYILETTLYLKTDKTNVALIFDNEGCLNIEKKIDLIILNMIIINTKNHINKNIIEVKNNGFLHLEKVIFVDIYLTDGFYVLFLENSQINLNKCEFKDIKLGKSGLIKIFNLKKEMIINLNEIKFININNDSKVFGNYIEINNIESNLIFKDILFSNINTYIFLSAKNINGRVKFDNCSFQDSKNEFQMINIENTKEIFINNISFNSIYGGTIRTKNVLSRTVYKLTILNCYSKQTSFGLKIFDSLEVLTSLSILYKFFENPNILINNCNFINNSLFYQKDFESGGALLVESPIKLQIINSFFKENNINSTRNVNAYITAPCLYSSSLDNSLYLKNNTFDDNHSKFLSNCLYFIGLEITFIETVFKNHCGVYDYLDYLRHFYGFGWLSYVHGQNAGCCLIRSRTIIIKDCLFFNNSNFQGGAIFLSKNSNSDQIFFTMNDTIFNLNEAGDSGSAIAFAKAIQYIQTNITNCFFSNGNSWLGSVFTFEFNHPDSLIYIKKSYFSNNLADMSTCFHIINLSGTVLLENNYFVNNTALTQSRVFIGSGSVAQLKGTGQTSLKLIDNIFIFNLNEYYGVIVNYSGLLNEINSFYFKNYAYNCAVSISISEGQNNIINSSFFSNYAYNSAGTIGVTDFSKTTIKGIKIHSNSAKDKGGIFFIDNAELNIYDCEIINNKANQGGLIFSINNFYTLSTFHNSIFKNNNAGLDLISSLSTSFLFINCTFKNNSASFASLTNSNLTFQTIIFENHEGNLIQAFFKSKIIILESYFNSISNYNEPNIYLEESILDISNCIFKEMRTLEGIGSIAKTFYSDAIISKSFFYYYDFNCFSILNSNLKLFENSFGNNNVKITNNFNRYGTIYCENCFFISICNNIFENNKNIYEGGSIYIIEPSINVKSDINIINNNTFINNIALQNGGSIFIKNSASIISNCRFEYNVAYKGAGIYITNDKLGYSNITIKKNIFAKNEAVLEGGGIKWTNKQPLISEDNLYFNNEAVYGPNVAAFPIKLKLSFFPPPIFAENINNYLLSNNLLLENISSGTKFKYNISLEILDVYSNIIKSIDNQNLISLKYCDQDQLIKINPGIEDEKSYKTIIGENPILFSKGEAIFNNIIIYAKPNFVHHLLIQTEAINQYYEEFILNTNKFKYETNINGKYYIYFSIFVKKCDIGEIFRKETNSCHKCAIGSYSLSDGMISTSCLSCQSVFDCPGGSVLNLIPGYWRKNLLTDQIHDCKKFQDFCRGGYDSNCSIGYHGPLCGSCIPGYAKSAVNTCQPCYEPNKNFVIILLVFLAFVVILFFFVLISVKDAEKQNEKTKVRKTINIDPDLLKKKILNESEYFNIKKGISIYLKILMNYLQMIAIIHTLDLKWPFYADDYLSTTSQVAGVTNEALSFDCILYDNNITEPAIHIKALCAVLLPLIILIFMMIYFIIVNINKKNNIGNRVIISIVVISIFLQPTILQQLFDNLNCNYLGEEGFLYKEMTLKCNEENHRKWVTYFVTPLLLLWIVIYPCTCLAYLYHNKNNLNSESVRSKMGFYINGFKTKYYYWEFVIMFRKIIFLVVSIFQEIAVELKTMILLSISFITFALIIYCAPYIIHEFNSLEYRSNIAAIITLYCGALYLNSFSNSLKAFLFVFIILTNIHFSIIWLVYLIQLIIHINFDAIFRFSPKLLICYLSFINTFDIISKKSTYNILKGWKTILFNFKNEYLKLKNNFQTTKTKINETKNFEKSKKLKDAVIIKI